jgi:hypothetical protein
MAGPSAPALVAQRPQQLPQDDETSGSADVGDLVGSETDQPWQQSVPRPGADRGGPVARVCAAERVGTEVRSRVHLRFLVDPNEDRTAADAGDLSRVVRATLDM